LPCGVHLEAAIAGILFPVLPLDGEIPFVGNGEIKRVSGLFDVALRVVAKGGEACSGACNDIEE